MSGKRKPSPELTVVFFDNDNKDYQRNNVASFMPTTNQQPQSAYHQDVTRIVRTLQRPQKQKPLLSARSKTYDSAHGLETTAVGSPSFDYDSVHSPGGSSNASSEEPTYVRTPGFEHHAQEFETQRQRQHSSSSRIGSASLESNSNAFYNDDNNAMSQSFDSRNSNGNNSNATITIKKKKSLVDKEVKEEANGGKKESSQLQQEQQQDEDNVSSKQKAKKEPLPMKLRALPQSFWQQPNHTNCLSPGAVYPILPPLCKDDGVDVTGLRSTTPPEDVQGVHRETISAANTDLLFSLFRGVEEEQRNGQSRVTVVRRGRPRKPPSNLLTRVLRDDDPCLISTVTESILPLIPDRSGSGANYAQTAKISQGQQVLAMVSLRDGDKSVSLPSLNVEHNYSQILSELVIKL